MRIPSLAVALSLLVPAPFVTPSLRAADEPIARPNTSPYAGHVVARVSPSTPAQLEAVQSIATGVLSERVGLGPIDVFLPREKLSALTALGLTPEVLVEDLEGRLNAQAADIEREAAAREARKLNPMMLRAEPSPHDIRFWDSYRSLLGVNTYLFDLAAAYPEMATLRLVGTSVDGREIWGLLISAPDTPENPRDQRKVVQWNGTQHAREWISTMTVLYLADRLLGTADSDPRVAGLLQNIEFAIVPISNPDGYNYTWTNYRMWRKNRKRNSGGSYGVDLNRNWSYQWGGQGASGSQSSDTYRGTGPFSEPESTAIADLASSFGSRFAGGIDYHSYSQLIMWGWGYSTTALLPQPERGIITALCIDMAGAIIDRGGEMYTPEKSTDLYPASGTADDWYQGETPGFGITIELRTTGSFDPPLDQVMACSMENYDAALLFAEGVTQPVRILPTSTIPAAAEHGAPLTIEARFLNALGSLDSATPTLHVRYPGATSEVSIPMSSTGSSTYAASLTPPDMPGRTTVRITAASTLGETASFPASGAYEITTLTSNTQTLLSDDFESDQGWTVGSPDDDASAGLWERGDPSLDPKHPLLDSTPGAGTLCYVTGLSLNNDVDGGYTRLVSPEIVLPAGAGDTIVSADLWRRVNKSDPMLVELAPDGTEDWTVAHVSWDPTASWRRHSLRVNDFISPEVSFRVRFSAMDLPSAGTTEMAVDDVLVEFAPATSPPDADINGDGIIDNGDIGAFVALFLAADPAADFNGDGVIDNGDIGAFITLFLQG